MPAMIHRLRGTFLSSALKKALNRIGYAVQPIDQAPWENWHGLTSLPIRTVLDIGALHGELAETILAPRFPNAIIHCFEPSPVSFPALEQTAARSAGRIVAYPFGLGETEAQVEFYSNRDFLASSSFLHQTDVAVGEFPLLEKVDVTRAQIRRLDDVAPGLHLAAELLVKIDTQGFEDRVIKGGRETLRGARACVIEISLVALYHGIPSFEFIHTQMIELGFRFSGILDQVHGSTGEVLYFDAVFVRR